jgi:hypothetical protein
MIPLMRAVIIPALVLLSVASASAEQVQVYELPQGARPHDVAPAPHGKGTWRDPAARGWSNFAAEVTRAYRGPTPVAASGRRKRLGSLRSDTRTTRLKCLHGPKPGTGAFSQ